MKIKICNCGHGENFHGCGLPHDHGMQSEYCTFAECECDEFEPIKLTHAELCRLGQIFHANPSVNVNQMSDSRIAEWIGNRIGEVEPKEQQKAA